MRANVARVEAERDRLADGLRSVGWRIGPSVTNFLLARFEDPAIAAATADALLRAGLVPRTFPEGHPLAASLRVTIRNPAENDQLIAAARRAVTTSPRSNEGSPG
jgi:histidinol-phosphate/aromatic aminotransferase/cobyric acid decarboxylase-like protein